MASPSILEILMNACHPETQSQGPQMICAYKAISPSWCMAHQSAHDPETPTHLGHLSNVMVRLGLDF